MFTVCILCMYLCIMLTLWGNYLQAINFLNISFFNPIALRKAKIVCSERPKLHTILAFLSAIGLIEKQRNIFIISMYTATPYLEKYEQIYIHSGFVGWPFL